MAQVPSLFITHSKKVCNLYKRALRNLESIHYNRCEFRYQAVLLRDRFDQNKNIKDLRVAKETLLKGEAELANNLHYDIKRFPKSPGGLAYDRHAHVQDWVLDFWDPMEKAQYPKFFAKREEMKKEYVEFYFKQYPEEKQKYLEEQKRRDEQQQH